MSIGEWRDAFEIHFGDLADRRWLETPFYPTGPGGAPGYRKAKPSAAQAKRTKARKAQKLARKRSRQ